MPVASKLTFIPFTPRDIGLPRKVYQSDRDDMRGELRGGVNSMLGIENMTMCYTAEEYARLIVWCLGLMLVGWPHYIPFANLSDVKGGARTLRILRDLLRDGTLKFVRAPPDVRARALHDPESVLPHVIAAAALPPPPFPLTLQAPKFDIPRFQDLLPRSSHVATSSRPRQSVSMRAPPAPAEEVVLHPDNLEPILSTPLGSDAPRTSHERRQRRDINKSRGGKKSHSRKVGPLTKPYVLDNVRAGGKPLKPLSELRVPLMVDDAIGHYSQVEVDDIESFSDVEV
ncbi:hypothetical protein V8D89_001033 [Ganoderma adspersum]